VSLQVASFFSGLGGLDSGFSLAGRGFQTIWANELEAQIAQSFEANHGSDVMVRGSLTDIRSQDVPKVDGMIGGPPCQSWSSAGARRGRNDPRGELFFKYVEVVSTHQPTFFVAENVPGLTHLRNAASLRLILDDLVAAGYNVSFGLLNAADYNVAQDRRRLFIIGYRRDTGRYFVPPAPNSRITLSDALNGLDPASAIPWSTLSELGSRVIPHDNHHFFDSGHFSMIYMSRNRVRAWDEQSFTIQASASHAPLHPQAPKMTWVGKDKFEFNPSAMQLGLYRRFSVREIALIQGFDAGYLLKYSAINTGYKMIGNAVPPPLAKAIATQIADDLSSRNHMTESIPTGCSISFEDLVSKTDYWNTAAIPLE
jgi:DNA (cytosine-5)-methyltransferase 1